MVSILVSTSVPPWQLSINWLVINIPRSSVRSGQTIAQYQPPGPRYRDSKYLVLVLLQSQVLNKSSVSGYTSQLCQMGPRANFNLRQFMTNFSLEMVVAANFFVVDRDSYVESIERYCEQGVHG